MNAKKQPSPALIEASPELLKLLKQAVGYVEMMAEGQRANSVEANLARRIWDLVDRIETDSKAA